LQIFYGCYMLVFPISVIKARRMWWTGNIVCAREVDMNTDLIRKLDWKPIRKCKHRREDNIKIEAIRRDVGCLFRRIWMCARWHLSCTSTGFSSSCSRPHRFFQLPSVRTKTALTAAGHVGYRRTASLLQIEPSSVMRHTEFPPSRCLPPFHLRKEIDLGSEMTCFFNTGPWIKGRLALRLSSDWG
jgi:hypothetical protein